MASFFLKETEEYLAGLIPLYNITGFRIENHGLRAKIEMSKFRMNRYMGELKDSPIGVLSAAVLDFKYVSWLHPDFFIQQINKGKNAPGMNFILSIKFLPTKQWYSFLQNELQSKNDKTKEIIFKKSLICETNVIYIGDKTYTFSDEIRSSNGVKLATVEMSYGLNDPILRTLDTLSIHAQSKRQFLKHNEKPPYIHTDIDPDKTARIIDSKYTVLQEHIDHNDHTNMGLYFKKPLINFTELSNKKTMLLKRFAILYKNESRLGATLQSICWRDDITYKYYCRTSSGEKLISFVEAEYHDDYVTSNL